MSQKKDFYKEYRDLKAKQNDLSEEEYFNRIKALRKNIREEILNDLETNYQQEIIIKNINRLINV